MKPLFALKTSAHQFFLISKHRQHFPANKYHLVVATDSGAIGKTMYSNGTVEVHLCI